MLRETAVMWILVGCGASACAAKPPVGSEATAVIEGFPIPAAPDAGPRGAAPLGESNYLPVAPGEHLRSLEEILTAPSESTIRWEERERRSIALQGVTLMAVVFELPGSGAGLVLLEPEEAGYRVVTTYGVQHGGLGVQMTITAAWIEHGQQLALLLVRADRESRGYYATAGEEWSYVEPSIDRSWLAVGVSLDHAWAAHPEMRGYSSVELDGSGSAPRLLGCRGAMQEVRVLDLSTRRFGAASTTGAPCPEGDAAAGGESTTLPWGQDPL